MMCRDHREHPETSSSAQKAMRVHREQQWYAGAREGAQGAVRMLMDQRECVGDLKRWPRNCLDAKRSDGVCLLTLVDFDHFHG